MTLSRSEMSLPLGVPLLIPLPDGDATLPRRLTTHGTVICPDAEDRLNPPRPPVFGAFSRLRSGIPVPMLHLCRSFPFPCFLNGRADVALRCRCAAPTPPPPAPCSVQSQSVWESMGRCELGNKRVPSCQAWAKGKNGKAMF